MIISQSQSPRALFRSEHECVEYLFDKRWPVGFICPFCHRHQPETRPAFTVVCHHCRKQTSITARTVMHGSRNSLISWMLVAWQFCSREQGISAREIQNLLALSSYQTSWKWLQKIRLAASLAESMPCAGTVLFGIRQFSDIELENERSTVDIGIALELGSNQESSRVRFLLVDGRLPNVYSGLVTHLVGEGSLLFVDDREQQLLDQDRFSCRSQNKKHQQLLTTTLDEAKSWLSRLYRKGVGGNYLQLYLDEFAFRFNTRKLQNRMAIFEQFLTGLLASPSTEQQKTTPGSNLEHAHLSGERR